MFTHVTHSSNFPFYKVNFWSIFPLNWNIELSFFSNSDITSFICMPHMSIHFHEADCSSCLPWGFWSWLVWECPDQLATGRRGVAACHSSKWPLSEKFTQSLKKTLQSEDTKKQFRLPQQWTKLSFPRCSMRMTNIPLTFILKKP